MKDKRILLVALFLVIGLAVAAVVAVLLQQKEVRETYTSTLQVEDGMDGVDGTDGQLQGTPSDQETTTEEGVGDGAVPQEEEVSSAEEPLLEESVDESLEIVEETEEIQEEPEQPSTQLQAELEAEQITQETIELLYAAQSDYQAALEGLVEQTKAEFLALPPEEQTQENKMALVDSKFDQISAMEKECDAQVEDLILIIARAQMTLGNTTLVNEIRSYYAESKATWKADCLTALAAS